jgi:hypothetical protein
MNIKMSILLAISISCIFILYYQGILYKKDKIISHLLKKCDTTLSRVEYDISPKGRGF